MGTQIRRLTLPKIKAFELNLTQHEISKRSQVQESVISLIFNGRLTPNPIEKARIAKAMGLPESEIFGGADDVC